MAHGPAQASALSEKEVRPFTVSQRRRKERQLSQTTGIRAATPIMPARDVVRTINEGCSEWRSAGRPNCPIAPGTPPAIMRRRSGW